MKSNKSIVCKKCNGNGGKKGAICKQCEGKGYLEYDICPTCNGKYSPTPDTCCTDCMNTGILKKEPIQFTRYINIHHNYAKIENHFGKNVWIHRKGATSAKKSELGIIPGSQGTNSYIVSGKGNIESFMSRWSSFSS